MPFANRRTEPLSSASARSLRVPLLLLLFGRLVAAQTTTATITGFVSDPTQAAVAGAKVTAANNATGFSRSVSTSADGSYTLPSLPIGTYRLHIERSGFKKYVQDDVGPLSADQVARVDVELQLSDVLETVVVTGTPPLLDTTSGAVRTPIYSDHVANLPLNSRSLVELLLEQPGAQLSRQYLADGKKHLGFNFNGANTLGNNIFFKI